MSQDECARLRENVPYVNHLTPNGHYIGRTTQLTSRCCILYIYSTNIRITGCPTMNVPDFGRMFFMLTIWRLTATILVVPHSQPPDAAFYIFIQQIHVLNILNLLH